MQPFRIDPAGPVQAYKTYEVAAPLTTHWRRASCEEVSCKPHRFGWLTTVESLVDADGQLEATVRNSGRRFTERRTAVGVEFCFPPGQECFAASTHRVPLEREPLYIVRDGDWRGNPTGRRQQHASAADFVDDFAEHQISIAEAHERG